MTQKLSFLSFFIFCMAAFNLNAQDVIVKTNGDEIKAKVEEVSTDQIRYRKYDNLEGPVYVIAKQDVFMIRYESGARDVFSDIRQTPDHATQNQTQSYLSSTEYLEARSKLRKGRRLVGFSVPMFVTGAILIGYGAADIAFANDYFNPFDPIDPYADDIWRQGVIMTSIGTALAAPSIPMFVIGLNRLGRGKDEVRAIERRHAELNIQPVFRVFGNGNDYAGLNLRLNF